MFVYFLVMVTRVKLLYVSSAFFALSYMCTQDKNRNATLFQWKIHGLLFKVIDGDNEPSSFQEMRTKSTKQCLK